MKKLWLHLSPLVLVACATTSVKPEQLTSFSSKWCEEQYDGVQKLKTHDQLNHISSLFSHRCYHEVIHLGRFIQSYHRDKFYNITAEAAEILTPEGTFTDYVLEGHERSYLSFLMALSHLKLNQTDDGLVELRRTSDEQKAPLYNEGDDLILNVLLGAIWDRYDTSISRPYWKKVAETALQGTPLLRFAENRLIQIDQSPTQTVSWNIEGFETLPELTWSYDLFQQARGPYKIGSYGSFPESCSSDQDLIVATDSWVRKISYKYQSHYHPLVYAKSLARFPVGVGYAVLGSLGGLAVGVGGCGIASQARGNGGELCEASLKAGVYLVKESTDLMDYTLRPDLRHWQTLPIAIGISSPMGSADSPCSKIRQSLGKSIQLSPVTIPEKL